MELNKHDFIKYRLYPFMLTEVEQNQVIEKILENWDNRFDFLPGPDIMPFLMENGIESSLAFKMMENMRKGNGLTPEWEVILTEKGISLEFVKRYENTLPSSDIISQFNGLLHKKVKEVRQIK